jgi:hypothetical protein
VRSLAIPPAPRTHHGGGVAANQEICQPHLPFPALKKRCCDGVAMRTVSSRCRLKSLRVKRWRRPLCHRRRAEGGPQHPSAMLWMLQVQPRWLATFVFNRRLAAVIRVRMSSDRRASRIAICARSSACSRASVVWAFHNCFRLGIASIAALRG